MTFVSRRLEARGIRAHLASPGHLRWQDGRARLEAAWWSGPLDLVVRFFPAEWLGELPKASGWRHLFAGSRTPISNPATALLTQSKRFPLVWDALSTPLPTWRALLPETRELRDAPWRSSRDWILKPALGRVGEGIGITGLTEAAELAEHRPRRDVVARPLGGPTPVRHRADHDRRRRALSLSRRLHGGRPCRRRLRPAGRAATDRLACRRCSGPDRWTSEGSPMTNQDCFAIWAPEECRLVAMGEAGGVRRRDHAAWRGTADRSVPRSRCPACPSRGRSRRSSSISPVKRPSAPASRSPNAAIVPCRCSTARMDRTR